MFRTLSSSLFGPLHLQNLRSDSPYLQIFAASWLGKNGARWLKEHPEWEKNAVQEMANALRHKDEDTIVLRGLIRALHGIGNVEACKAIDVALGNLARQLVQNISSEGKKWSGEELFSWDKSLTGVKNAFNEPKRMKFIAASLVLHDIRDCIEKDLPSFQAIRLALLRVLLDAETTIGDRQRTFTTLKTIDPVSIDVLPVEMQRVLELGEVVHEAALVGARIARIAMRQLISSYMVDVTNTIIDGRVEGDFNLILKSLTENVVGYAVAGDMPSFTNADIPALPNEVPDEKILMLLDNLVYVVTRTYAVQKQESEK